MAPRPRPASQRARDALGRLTPHAQLPEILTSREVKPLMGRTWFHESLSADLLPGIQIIRCGVWRCHRDTFVAWLNQLADS